MANWSRGATVRIKVILMANYLHIHITFIAWILKKLIARFKFAQMVIATQQFEKRSKKPVQLYRENSDTGYTLHP